MRDLIKKVLNEAKKPLVGCDFFENHTNDYRWCKYAENKLMKNTRKVEKAMDDYKRDYLSTYTTGIRAVKYDKKLQFFSERRDMVIDALEKFQSSCPKLRKYVIDSMVRFTEKYVIWNEKEQYDLLSKLNTNYSGAAYMLTVGLPEKYKNSVSYEDALKYFFDEKNKDGVTPFERFMGELETENKIYLQGHEVVQKLAIQPKNTNNNNKIKINNNFFDNPEKIKQMIDEKLTKDYISEGQKGVAQFACNNLLKDENGNMNYICSDLSRNVFKFYNIEGNIEKDVKANKLTNMLIEAGIANKALSVAPSLWTDEDGNINSNKFLIFSPYTTEIASMQVDNSVFRNELASLTS